METQRADGARRRKPALYVSAGRRMLHFDVDVERAELVARGSVDLPQNVQYAWPHASREFLYVATSDGGPGGVAPATQHHASVLRIDPHTGSLALHGGPRPLAHRPVHLTTDVASACALVAYNNPSGLTVHRIERDGRWGEPIVQRADLDFGIYAHQVRVRPDDRSVILVSRGNTATAARPEDPGALNVFDYRDGMLTPRFKAAPGGGYGFGPRHLDFHPGGRWLLVSLERQNALHVFAVNDDGTISPSPLHRCATLADPAQVRHRQLAGTLHVHPRGHIVYVANRALGLEDYAGRKVSIGGETTLTVFAIDPRSGAPTRIQDIDTHGASPRTFALDPSGRLLVVANSVPLLERRGEAIVETPRNLAVFRVDDDGRLAYVRRYDLPDAGGDLLWMNMIG